MIKVSFDFDDTLSRESVQKYAKEIINKGVEVWICTARVGDRENDYAKDWNDDLYEIADELGIKRDHIKFMEFADKYEFFKDSDFLWHLDDDWCEVRLINKNTTTVGITHIGAGDWIKKCNKIIKKHDQI
jgi:hypothetical protein